MIEEGDSKPLGSTILFLKNFFLEDINPFVGLLINLFWTSGDVASGFQSQNGLSYSHLTDCLFIKQNILK